MCTFVITQHPLDPDKVYTLILCVYSPQATLRAYYAGVITVTIPLYDGCHNCF